MEKMSLGFGTTEEFFANELQALDLRDKRLHQRALKIYKALQSRLTSCVRGLFLDPKEMRQAYDFF